MRHRDRGGGGVTGIITEQRPTYRAPGTARRYLTRHAAYIAWAKHLIFAAYPCDCDPDTGAAWCPRHTGLFERMAWVCPRCGCDQDDRAGGTCVSMECGGAKLARRTVPDTERYLRLRDRLVRWLKWRDRKAAE